MIGLLVKLTEQFKAALKLLNDIVTLLTQLVALQTPPVATKVVITLGTPSHK